MSAVTALAFQDGVLLVARADKTLTVVRGETELRVELSAPLREIEWAPGEATVFAGRPSREPIFIASIVWTGDRARLESKEVERSPSARHFAWSGRQLAVAGDQRLHMFDRNGVSVSYMVLERPCTALACSGPWMAIGDASGITIHRQGGPSQRLATDGKVSRLCWSRSAKYLAFIAKRTLHVLELASRVIQMIGPASGLAWSANDGLAWFHGYTVRIARNICQRRLPTSTFTLNSAPTALAWDTVLAVGIANGVVAKYTSDD